MGWVREGTRIQRGPRRRRAADQPAARSDSRLAARKVLVKVNCIIIPGINDADVAEVARTVKECGPRSSIAFPCTRWPTRHSRTSRPRPTEPGGLRAGCGGRISAADVPLHALPGRRGGPAGRGHARRAAGLPQGSGRAAAQPRSRSGLTWPWPAARGCWSTSTWAKPARWNSSPASPTASAASSRGQRPPRAAAGTLDRVGGIVRTTAARSWWPGAGGTPKATLAKHGIRLVMMEGLIEEGLNAVFQNLEIRARRCTASIPAAAAAVAA